MTLFFIALGSAAFAGIAARFASRLARRYARPFAVR